MNIVMILMSMLWIIVVFILFLFNMVDKYFVKVMVMDIVIIVVGYC